MMKSTISYVTNFPKYDSNAIGNRWKPRALALTQPSVGSIPGRTQLGPLDDLVSGKLAIIEQSLKQVYEEIEARQKIHGSLIEELDREHCRQMEALRQVAPHGSSLFTIGDLRRRSGLEKELAALENEKRHEQVAVWKDVGSDRFLSRLEGMLGRSVRPRPIGRPKGWRKKK